MPQQILPSHLLELQLAQIDLLQAMYPDKDTIIIDDSSSVLLDQLRTVTTAAESTKNLSSDAAVSFLLTLEADQDHKFQLQVAIPVAYQTSDEELEEPPRARIRLVQPSWMSKADAFSITINMAQNDDEDLFARIEEIKDAVVLHLSSPSLTSSTEPTDNQEISSFVRVWFYFPSISTRSKRDDIVNYAPTYNLTGFLLSGKPGVLCLEGPSDKVDAYMKFIKTESWGDIPAHHKKVTERLREAIMPGKKRVFKDMQEITDNLGERRGERANRNDMKLLEAWLMERGLGDAFMKVLT